MAKGGRRRGPEATPNASAREKPAQASEAGAGASGEAPSAAARAHVGAKVAASVGVVAAMVLAVLVNVLVARHYRRWDLTTGGLYTLSAATLETLRSLEEPVHVHVLLSSGDPLSVSVRHLLDAYRAETTRLEVHYTDPDRNPAEFLATQQRYGIVAGKTEDGRIVTDASIVVVRGDKPHFITSRDLVEVDDADDFRARPRLEQAITTGIRSVLSNERPKVCFTTGHGEREPDSGGSSGLAPLRERLVKNNYEVAAIPSIRAQDGKPNDEEASLSGCRLLVVAGPSEKVPPEDVARYRAFVEGGGSALVAVGPVPDADDRRYLALGLDDLLATAGVKLRHDFVFELDPKHRSLQGYGETFMPIAKPHPVTEGILREADRGLAVVMTVGSSLAPTGSGAAAPAALLETSESAFGMVDFFGWAKNPTPPAPGDGDTKGPLVVAYATELPKKPGSPSPHGARVLVVSSPSVLFGANWQNEELRGTALFVESAVSWLAARPPLVDIPAKPSYIAALRLTDDSIASIFRYVVVFMPLSVALLGTAVHLRRRRTERRGERPAETA